MAVSLLLALSAAGHLAAARESYLVARRAGTRMGWTALAAGNLFLFVKRFVDLYLHRAGYHVVSVYEATAFVLIAALLLLGMRILRSLFAELRRSRQQIRESEERYRRMVETADDAILVTDMETGIVLEANPKVAELLGMPCERIVGEPRDWRDDALGGDAEATARGGAGRLQTVRRADGRLVPVEVSEGETEIGGRRVLLEIYRDVTGRLEAEEELRRLADIFRHTRVGVAVCSPDCRTIARVNPAFAEMHGATAAEMAGVPVTDVFPPEEHRALQGHLRTAHEQGHEIFASRHLRRDGSTFPVLVDVTTVKEEDGRVLYRIVNVQDMTEARRAEEARARLSLAVEQAGEAIIVTDAAGAIEYVNPAFERVTGWRRDEVVGKTPRILASGKHDARFYRAMWETLARGETWKGHLVNRRRDGGLVEAEAVISPVRDGAGNIVEYVAVERDVTREREMEEQLRLSQRLEAVGSLAGGVAHEFNNLMTAVLGYADLLLARHGEDPKSQRELSEIRKAGTRAAQLTRQLLAFSRKQFLQPKVIGLNDVVRHLDGTLRHMAGEAVEVAVELQPDLGEVSADPGQLEQAIVHLALNACDAMPDGGRLSIRTRNLDPGDLREFRKFPLMPPGRYVVLSVCDTGAGMSEEMQARVFDPFFSTKEKGTAQGMGLAMVYGFVKQSGGYVWVESEPGKGTTFHVCLPRTEETADTGEAASSGRLPGGNETVLVAEDEDMVRELVREILEGSGYRVLAAPDGKDALSLAERYRGRIHLLVSDMVMPRMGGRELAERLVSLRPGVKVIFISGYQEEVSGGKDPGRPFLQKPFRADALIRKVRQVLDAPAAGARGGSGAAPGDEVGGETLH